MRRGRAGILRLSHRRVALSHRRIAIRARDPFPCAGPSPQRARLPSTMPPASLLLYDDNGIPNIFPVCRKPSPRVSRHHNQTTYVRDKPIAHLGRQCDALMTVS